MNQSENPYRPRPDNKTQALLDSMSAENRELLEERERARMAAVIGWMLFMVALAILSEAATENRATDSVDASVMPPARACIVRMSVEAAYVEPPTTIDIDVINIHKDTDTLPQNLHDAFHTTVWRPLDEARSIGNVSVHPYAIVTRNGNDQ